MVKVGDLISLAEAARQAGYSGASALRKAAQAGTLRTVRTGPRSVMTTATWVKAYEANKDKRGRLRGTVVKEVPPDAAAAEEPRTLGQEPPAGLQTLGSGSRA
jgi:hypothetical protein